MTEVFGISYWPSLQGKYDDTKTPRSDIVVWVYISFITYTDQVLTVNTKKKKTNKQNKQTNKQTQLL